MSPATPTKRGRKLWTGEKLRQWRMAQPPPPEVERRSDQQYLAQHEAAARAGVSERTWRRYEETNPPHWLVKLIEAGSV